MRLGERRSFVSVILWKRGSLSGSCSSARTDFRFEVLSSRGCRLCAAIALSAAQIGRGNSEAIHDAFIQSCIDRSIAPYSIDQSSSYRD